MYLTYQYMDEKEVYLCFVLVVGKGWSSLTVLVSINHNHEPFIKYNIIPQELVHHLTILYVP